MNRKHLLGEHLEIHTLLNGGWANHPEAKRFKGERGRSLLLLRHELLRVGMAVRYGVARHGRDTHRTPVDTDAMSHRASACLLMYERAALPPAGQTMTEAQWLFQRLMGKMKWPPCELEGYAITPWDRDEMSMAEYVKLGDAWTRSANHHKARESK